MLAQVLERVGGPLMARRLERPRPGPGQALLRVAACGVCRTDLHVLDGDLEHPALPLIPGHQIVGVVEEPGDTSLSAGDRVGVPWLGWTCGECSFCAAGQENLCAQARFTGYDLNGGYAQWAVADARYCFPIPPGYPDAQAAPLLCAGLIGYRSYRMAGEVERLGLYGFGSAAHIINQVAVHDGVRTYAFTRPGDEAGQRFACELGACWAGDSDSAPPEPLDAAIIFAPVGALVPAALSAVRPGGVVVCAGIHMTDIPSFPYQRLWMERSIRSVANLTRRDGEQFLAMAPRIPIQTSVTVYPLDQANRALDDLRQGRFEGAAVLDCGQT